MSRIVSGMGDLLGFVPFSTRRAAPASRRRPGGLWAGLVAVSPAEAAVAVLIAAGDIADCSSVGDSATAALVGATGGRSSRWGTTPTGRAQARQFANCYGPTWGRFKAARGRHSGNHEYDTTARPAYFDYFGAAAGRRARAGTATTLGGWHVVVLNSNCSQGGCRQGFRAGAVAAGRPGRAPPHQCTLAYWHHPRFCSDGEHGNDAGDGAVLGGAVRRTAPMSSWPATPTTTSASRPRPGWRRRSRPRDPPVRGRHRREEPLRLRAPCPTARCATPTAFGVLKLTLHPGSYDWRVPARGRARPSPTPAPPPATGARPWKHRRCRPPRRRPRRRG